MSASKEQMSSGTKNTFQDFQNAQAELSNFLLGKLQGDILNESTLKRAQRLANKWWQSHKPVVIGETLQIIGCQLGFGFDTIRAEKWLTRFVIDRFEVSKLVRGSIALGYVNGFQLYLADVGGVWTLCARSDHQVLRWSAKELMTPPTSSPLFVALERTKALGYLNLLRGLEQQTQEPNYSSKLEGSIK